MRRKPNDRPDKSQLDKKFHCALGPCSVFSAYKNGEIDLSAGLNLNDGEVLLGQIVQPDHLRTQDGKLLMVVKA